MAINKNISTELDELGSTLANQDNGNIYAVPAGYFDGLAAEVLRRVKALNAADARSELAELSPILAGISKNMPYALPAGYFEELDETVEFVMAPADAQEELASISPLLGGIKKDMPYSVPAGYFDTVSQAPATGITNGKVVSMNSRRLFKYAAAAIITGVIATLSVILINNNNNPSIARVEKKLNNEIEKTSDTELKDFIQYTESGQDLVLNEPKDEVKELLKDVPVSELEAFLDETADPSISVEETSTME